MINGNKNEESEKIKVPLSDYALQQIENDVQNFRKKSANVYKNEIISKILNGHNSGNFDRKMLFCESVYTQACSNFKEIINRPTEDFDDMDKLEFGDFVSDKCQDDEQAERNDRLKENVDIQNRSDNYKTIQSFFSGLDGKKNKIKWYINWKSGKGETDHIYCRISVRKMKEILLNTGIEFSEYVDEDVAKNVEELLENAFYEVLQEKIEAEYGDTDTKGSPGNIKIKREARNTKFNREHRKNTVSVTDYSNSVHAIIEHLKVQPYIQRISGYSWKLEKAKNDFEAYKKKAVYDWIKYEVFEEAYFKWADKCFNLDTALKRDADMRVSEELRITAGMYSRLGAMCVFDYDIRKLFRAVLEYYASLPDEEREQIAYSNFYNVVVSRSDGYHARDLVGGLFTLCDKNKNQYPFVLPHVERNVGDHRNYIVGYDVNKKGVGSVALRQIDSFQDLPDDAYLETVGIKLPGNKKDIMNLIVEECKGKNLSELGQPGEIKKYMVQNMTEKMVEAFRDCNIGRPMILGPGRNEPAGPRRMMVENKGKKEWNGKYYVELQGIKKNIEKYFKILSVLSDPEFAIKKNIIEITDKNNKKNI